MSYTIARIAYYVLFKKFYWKFGDRDLEYGDFVIRIIQKRVWKDENERKRRYYELLVHIYDRELGRRPTDRDLEDAHYILGGGYFIHCIKNGSATWYPDTQTWLEEGAMNITNYRRGIFPVRA